MATNDRKDAFKRGGGRTNVNVKVMSKTANSAVVVKSVKVANNEQNTSSSTSKPISRMNKNSITPNNAKRQQPISKAKISEQPKNSNKVTTRANPSTKLTEIPKTNDDSQSKVTVKVEEKMPSSRNSGPTKTLNSASCNDKSTKRSTLTSRVWNRNVPPQSKSTVKDVKPLPDNVITPPQVESLAVQTNETEILNPLLVIGDAKVLTPSKPIIREIERHREERQKKQMLNAKRKFGKHFARQEEHLDNLNEFLEKAYITRKQRPITDNDDLEEDKKLITSMDQLMKQNIPKTESVSVVKERIKRKEQELLNLLDTCW